MSRHHKAVRTKTSALPFEGIDIPQIEDAKAWAPPHLTIIRIATEFLKLNQGEMTKRMATFLEDDTKGDSVFEIIDSARETELHFEAIAELLRSFQARMLICLKGYAEQRRSADL